MTVTIGLAVMLSSFTLAFIAGRITRHVFDVRDRRAMRVRPRYAVKYRDDLGAGVWCTFETLAQAQEAIPALNDVYHGVRRFWLEGATDPDERPAEAPAYIAEYVPGEWQGRRPDEPPREHIKPKPGTPIVRQDRTGHWFVRDGMFEIGYGSGEAGYRAALAAVERAHKV